MPDYSLLDRSRSKCWFETKAESRRVISHLERLRSQLKKEIPQKIDGKLLLATWNIRDFGSDKAPMDRLPESIIYMAEIIAAFDLVALQEVNKNLKEFNRLREALGDDYKCFMTDMPDENQQNNERMVYLYDTKKVSFRDVAGEVTLPTTKAFKIPGGKKSIKLPTGSIIKSNTHEAITVGHDMKVEIDLPEDQMITANRNYARTPYLVAFQSGWFQFYLCTAHIYYGNKSESALNIRAMEIDRLTKTLKKRAQEEFELYGQRETYIVLGDFNIHSHDHATMQAFSDNGFIIPENLQTNPTTMLGTSYYDQIAFLNEDGLMQRVCALDGSCKAGSFDFYKSVFRSELASHGKKSSRQLIAEIDTIESDFQQYTSYFKNDLVKSYWTQCFGRSVDRPGTPAPLSDDMKNLYFLKRWRTYQMSDHIPLWVELDVDHADEYLETID